MDEQVEVIVVSQHDGEGAKGIGRARDKLLEASAVSVSALSDNMSALCGHIEKVFAATRDSVSALELEAIETTVEVTAKGEVRLIGAASAEIKGGLKLIFRRRAQ